MTKVIPINSHPKFPSDAPICILPRQGSGDLDEVDPIHVDMALGMFSQNVAEDRDDLVKYAIRKNLTMALPGFLERRGWLDDDWVRRLEKLGVKRQG